MPDPQVQQNGNVASEPLGLNKAEMDSLASQFLTQQDAASGPPMEMQEEAAPADHEPEGAEVEQSGLDPDLAALQVEATDSPDIAAEKQKLLKSYSRAMNKLHKGKGQQQAPEGLAEGEDINTLRQHSQLLQTILQNPNSAEALAAVKQLTGANPQQQAQQAVFPQAKEVLPHLGKEVLEFLNEEHQEPMVNLQLAMLEKVLLPKLMPYVRYVEQLAMQNQQSSVQGIEKKYPALKTEQGKQWLKQARQYVNEKGMDLEEALFAVSRGKILVAKPKAADERVNGSVRPNLPSTSPTRTEAPTKAGPIDQEFKDTLAEELLAMDAQGTQRYFRNRIGAPRQRQQ